nr:putative ribonuclease H-like domain-containing protein [Tanacetum cinerariifolium]
TGKVNIPPARPQSVPTGKPKVFASVPTSRPNRSFPVSTDRGYSPSTYTPYVPIMSYTHMKYGGDRRATTVKPSVENSFSATEDEGIFDNGCSRSMTGNKERLDDFQEFQGEKVMFGGGEGRITGKGTIRTPSLDFENVYYVKELQKFNLFSISQICDKKNQVLFINTECLVLSKDFKLPDESMVVLRIPRKQNLYTINLNNLCPKGNLACLVAHASVDEFVKWHRRMGHVNYKNMNRLVKGNLVRGHPLNFLRMTIPVLHAVKVSNTNPLIRPLMLHFKPFGCHVTILNISDHLGKFDGKADEGYIVGYSASNKAYRVYNVPHKRVEETMNLRFLEEKPNVQGTQGAITSPACTQGADSDSNYDKQVIIVPSYPYHSIPRSEPKDTSGDEVDDYPLHFADKIFQKELARLKGQAQRATSDAESLGLGFANNAEELPTQASAKTVPPGCIPVPTGNVLVPPGSLPVPTGSIPVPTGNTVVSSSSTDLFFDDEPTIRFPSPSDLGNHDPSHGIFSSLSYDDEFGAALNNVASTMEVSPVATTRINTIHPQSLIIRDPTSAVQTRSKVKQTTTGNSAFIRYMYDQQRDNHTDLQHCLFACFLSQVKPTSVAQALEDPSWVDAIQEEMQQFKFQNVWVLVDFPEGKYAIGTKWILKNKRDARGIVVRNKTRLVAQGHRQEEGIDYDEVFALVARIEAIHLFLAFASYMGFMVYQMDVKSAFLYGRINGEVYVTQPKGFVDPQHPKKVYKVVKALYGLHQAPKAWYATLSTFLLKHGYRRGTINKTLFLKKNNRDIILVQVYVDDIIFGSTKKTRCLQVQQRPDGIFINQDKYVQEILNKFDLGSVRTTTTPYEATKPKSKNESDSPVNVHLYRSMIGSLMYLTASRPDIMLAVSACLRNQVTPTTSNLEAVKKIFMYLKGQPKLGLWYPKELPLVLEAYSDSDYARANKDRKSTTGGCTLDTKSVVRL